MTPRKGTARPPVAGGRDVVFSTTEWLTKRALANPRRAEIAGTVYEFRPHLTTTDAARFDELLATPGKWPEALAVLLVDPEQTDQLVGMLPVPVSQKALRAYLREFVEAVCGDLGESEAS